MTPFKPSRVGLFLFLLLLTPSEETSPDHLGCNICRHLIPYLSNTAPIVISNVDPLTSGVWEAFRHTLSLNMPARSEQAMCAAQGYCSKYSKKISCEISKMLMGVAESNKDKAQDEFSMRLHESCQHLEFLDPPCNMIVDQYSVQMHQLAAENLTPADACSQIGLCPHQESTGTPALN